MQGFSCKRCNAQARIKWRWGKFKHAMVGIKYEITTDLPVGKGSKFRVFWMRHFIPSTLISLTKKFQSVTPLRKKLLEKFVHWYGVWGARDYHLVLFWLGWTSHDTYHPVVLPLKWYVEITYLDCIVMWSVSRLMQCSLLLVIRQRQ